MEIPNDVTVSIDQGKISVKGKQGEVTRLLSPLVNVSVTNNAVVVEGQDKSLVNTTNAHIRNMVKGVQDGFTLKLKIVFAHFPISVETKGTEVTIKNFLGEKQPRKTVLVGKTKLEVKAKEQLVILSGPDKEAVGASYSNLRAATKIKEKDGRVFQDGLYIIS